MAYKRAKYFGKNSFDLLLKHKINFVNLNLTDLLIRLTVIKF